MSTYKYMNINEAAEYTGYKISTIYKKTSEQSIPFLGGKSKLEFDPIELDQWRQLGRTAEAAKAIMNERLERIGKKIGMRIRKMA